MILLRYIYVDVRMLIESLDEVSFYHLLLRGRFLWRFGRDMIAFFTISNNWIVILTFALGSFRCISNSFTSFLLDSNGCTLKCSKMIQLTGESNNISLIRDSKLIEIF